MLDTAASTGDEKRSWKYFQCYEKDETLKHEVAAAWNHQFNGSCAYQFSTKLTTTRKFLSK